MDAKKVASMAVKKEFWSVEMRADG